ncbi:hypothetical protein [Paracoccus pacificus]|uniref:Class I SAM-dependent methyltransferase n=1 Tax=Paracoccus pacificus TaxID=1463598 RepID=A0ABW4R4D1_9RHOB
MQVAQNNQGSAWRPELTFPAGVAEWVKDHYRAAPVILEYGSGGSTVMAAEMPGKTIFTVESDKGWLDNLQACLDRLAPPSVPHLHWADVGPTMAWGRPRNEANWRLFHRYPLSVWDRPDFVTPDLVLIDGRFRAACFATVLFRAEKPVTVLFDDYTDRTEYHLVEEWAKPVETRGRMARFQLEPRRLTPNEITRFVALFGQIR